MKRFLTVLLICIGLLSIGPPAWAIKNFTAGSTSAMKTGLYTDGVASGSYTYSALATGDCVSIVTASYLRIYRYNATSAQADDDNTYITPSYSAAGVNYSGDARWEKIFDSDDAGGMVYPGAGVPSSTGSAWGSSYAVGTAANNLVQLNPSAQLPAVSGALLTGIGWSQIGSTPTTLSGYGVTSVPGSTLDIHGTTAETTVADNMEVLLYDPSAGANRRMTKVNFTNGLGGGSGMTWPGESGIAVYSGSSSWSTSKTAPSGDIVGTTDAQSLTNKKLGSLTTNGFVKTSGSDGTLSVDTNTYLTPTGNGSGLTNVNAATLNSHADTYFATSGANSNITSLSGLSTPLSMAQGGLGASLSDPGFNGFLGWDDTDNSVSFWHLGTGLTYDHSTHTISSSAAAGSTTFDLIGTGTNTSGATMTVGNTSSLTYTGTGTINASTLQGNAASAFAAAGHTHDYSSVYEAKDATILKSGTTLGTFTGTIIDDDSTISEAFQLIETAIEGIETSGLTDIDDLPGDTVDDNKIDSSLINNATSTGLGVSMFSNTHFTVTPAGSVSVKSNVFQPYDADLTSWGAISPTAPVFTGASIQSGVAGSQQGGLILASDAGPYDFRIIPGTLTTGIIWRSPAAMPGGNNYLINIDQTTGQMDYTDPATFAAAGHNHTGTYEPADANILKTTTTLGTFTGTTIPDDQTVKQSLQALETALEGISAGGLADIDDLPGDTVDDNLIDAALLADLSSIYSTTGHTHTGSTISGIDISDDTNLSGDTEIVLTGDALSIASGITRDAEWDSIAEIEAATGVNIIVNAEIDSLAELNAIVGVTLLSTSSGIDASNINSGTIGVAYLPSDLSSMTSLILPSNTTVAHETGVADYSRYYNAAGTYYTQIQAGNPVGNNTVTLPTTTGTLALLNSPSFTTPTLGAALATSIQFADQNASPTVAGQLQYDNTISGIDDGAFVWYDDDNIQTIVSLGSVTSFASGSDGYQVTYHYNGGAGYFDLQAAGSGSSLTLGGDGTPDGQIQYANADNNALAAEDAFYYDAPNDTLHVAHVSCTDLTEAATATPGQTYYDSDVDGDHAVAWIEANATSTTADHEVGDITLSAILDGSKTTVLQFDGSAGAWLTNYAVIADSLGITSNAQLDGADLGGSDGELSFKALVDGTMTEFFRLCGACDLIHFTKPLETPASTETLAGLKIPSGTAPSSPAEGDIYYDGTHLYFKPAGAAVDLLVGTGSGLASTDIDTSAELRGILTDELGTGALLFDGAGGITLDSTLDSAGDFGFSGNAFGFTAQPSALENMFFTASENLWTFSSSTGATFAFTPNVLFSGNVTVNGTLTEAATATPGWTAYDSDCPGTDKEIGSIAYQYSSGADGAENGYSAWSVMHGGSEVEYLRADGVNDLVSTAKDIEITSASTGLIIRDTNGVRYRITISTSGVLTATSL